MYSGGLNKKSLNQMKYKILYGKALVCSYKNIPHPSSLENISTLDVCYIYYLIHKSMSRGGNLGWVC